MKDVKIAIEKYSELMNRAERYIWNNPEVGYKEFKTNDYMIAEFEKLGYKVARYEGITGFNAYYDTGKEGATVLVLAELDGLYCANHPECDKQTGAVHVCGHNIQCASLLGVAAAIREETINGELSGRVKFGVVPAEEGIELSFRTELIKKGVISFSSGKPECISRGLLDDVDVAFMMHIKDLSEYGDGVYYFNKGSNGVIRKKTIIRGRASHAGSSPWDGINALYAAELSLNAVNALRETFKEEDYVRFHSIITKGGESVNAIPEEVVIESYVRGASPTAIRRANKKINRAITGACLSIGACVTISDMAGSEPLIVDAMLLGVMSDVAKRLVGDDKCTVTTNWEPASTDMGDVSCIVPSVHGYMGGQSGLAHGKDYAVENPAKTCVDSATVQLGTIIELLKDGSKKAYDIKSNFKPIYPSVKDYLAQKKALSQTVDCIEYDGDKIKINL